MIPLLLFAALVCGARSASLDSSCAYGEWSSCRSTKHCPAVPAPIWTRKMEATSEWDEGRSAMMRLMKDKQDTWDARDRCIADGTCLDIFKKPIRGSYRCVGGIAGDIPCQNAHQLSFLTFADMGYPNGNAAGNDVWGWEDPETGDEYAIMGFNGGTAFVRVTDPENPVPVAFMYSTGNTQSSWRDIKVIGNYAFVVSEAANHGLQVFNLLRLRGQNGNPVQVVTPDAVNNDFGQAHNVNHNAETGFIYVIGARSGNYPLLCRGGLLVIDVKNPLQPTFAGCFGDDGYVHDTQCVVYRGPDTNYFGHEVCMCFNENSFTIVDVTNKQNMFMISKATYPNVAYTHQGWLTEDQTIVIMDDEQDETGRPTDQQFTKTYVWDVRILSNPQLRSIYQAAVRSIDHNLYIIGDIVYQANYESGLRVLHLNRETFELELVAYFDIFPSRTTAAYNGAWSCYPYFKSGNIAVSTIESGLFMVELDMVAIQALIDSHTTMGLQSRMRPANSSTCPHIRELETRICPAPVLC